MLKLLWIWALSPDWVLIDTDWGTGGPRRQSGTDGTLIDFVVLLALGKVLSPLPTGNQDS